MKPLILSAAASIVALGILTTPAHAAVVISEILWSGSPLSTSDEWLELTCVPDANGGMCPQDVSGWQLSYLNSSSIETRMVKFATGTLIGTGAFVIANDPADQSALLADAQIITSDVSLANTKLKLWLRDALGTLMDEADDGVGNPFAGQNTSVKASMERINPYLSGLDPTNWQTTILSSGIDDGIVMQCTPGWIPWVIVEEHSSVSSLTSSASSVDSSQFSSSESSYSIISSSSPAPASAESSASPESLASSSALSSSFLSSSASLASPASSVPSSQSSQPQAPVLPTIAFTEILPDLIGADDNEWLELANLGETDIDIAGWTLMSGTKSFKIPKTNTGAFMLWPGRYLAFHKPITALDLPNTTGTVKLLSGSLLIDEWTYASFKEGISLSRMGSAVTPLCTPSPDGPNVVVPPDISINIQSGETSGEVPLSLNIEVRPATGFTCSVDFGDGTTSIGCNPGAHSYQDPGSYILKATATDACNVRTERTLTIEASEEASSAPKSVSSSKQSSLKSSKQSSERSSKSAKSSSLSSIASSISSNIPFEFIGSPWINEVSPIGGKGKEWIELFNPEIKPISLEGWQLDDIANGGSKPQTLTGIVMLPSETLLISTLTISLNDDGDDVRLLSPDGIERDVVNLEGIKTGTTWNMMAEGVCISTQPTPGEDNICVTTPVKTATTKAAAQKKITAPTKTTAVKNSSLGVKTVYAVADTGSGADTASGSLDGLVDEELYTSLLSAALTPPSADTRSSGIIGWKVATTIFILIIIASWAVFFREQLLVLIRRLRE